tara:strand:+ start:70 stop:354 length:285 start_codon:yes stop_codon:yes gene_type:complete
MKLTREKVERYFKSRTNEELRHCPECIALACNDVANEYSDTEFGKAAEAMDYMRLLFFNDPVKGMFTHSYGFHTRTGRNIIEKLKEKYYEYERN